MINKLNTKRKHLFKRVWKPIFETYGLQDIYRES